MINIFLKRFDILCGDKNKKIFYFFYFGMSSIPVKISLCKIELNFF